MNPIRRGEHSRLNRTEMNATKSVNDSRILPNTTSRF
jgi:hypothetical protein